MIFGSIERGLIETKLDMFYHKDQTKNYTTES